MYRFPFEMLTEGYLFYRLTDAALPDGSRPRYLKIPPMVYRGSVEAGTLRSGYRYNALRMEAGTGQWTPVRVPTDERVEALDEPTDPRINQSDEKSPTASP